ncbi:MAG: molybdenum cofactor guanylyltransferase, partial [Candidatus Bathyarchaeia archaeon]
MERAAIILAGGLAERFQVKGEKWTDKALASLFGKPLLIHVIERVEPVVEEIIICVNSGARRRRYYKVLQNFSIKNVEIHTDVRYAHIRGPAVAITTGLRAAKAERCMILPCDTPFIQPTVIDYLFNACKKSSMVVPIHSNGRLETLMFACKRLPTARIAETLCLLKRDRPDDIIRGSSQVNFVSTIGELKELDPEFKSFVNINFRKDLTFLPTRAFDDGPIRKSINIKLGSPTSDELNMLKQATKG